MHEATFSSLYRLDAGNFQYLRKVVTRLFISLAIIKSLRIYHGRPNDDTSFRPLSTVCDEPNSSILRHINSYRRRVTKN